MKRAKLSLQPAHSVLQESRMQRKTRVRHFGGAVLRGSNACCRLRTTQRRDHLRNEPRFPIGSCSKSTQMARIDSQFEQLRHGSHNVDRNRIETLGGAALNEA